MVDISRQRRGVNSAMLQQRLTYGRGHAGVLGVQHDANTARSEWLLQPVGVLARKQPLWCAGSARAVKLRDADATVVTAARSGGRTIGRLATAKP